ncbi:MAG: hypothetical protein KDC43_24405 [Saprospiraceae bacterium]|nr:hypothetical protein [Saprospiraceae bacterium]MCB0626970.1 hypothetical protein [Saprospiraceae bacterium]MCB0681866.1 hypothetical protein [Saprospiraceae bacterium]
MTIGTLVLIIGIVALVLTLVVGLVFRAQKSWLMSFLQNFCGALFVFSGWVKAIDPLGTAYKMEQYFAEFEALFQGTWFSFLSPLFPWLSGFSVGFSVFMIVFEIALGIMLIIGARPKFTSWAFFLLVGFFTILTGFTYLTGYVPTEATFFEFSKWVPFQETNMKVTDCGCFGDFIKLQPRTSFFKDIVLLFPAFFFLWKPSKMHQLFSAFARGVIVVLGVVGLTLYCMSNYVWDLPHTDFRPFKEGVDVAERKALESEALDNVEILFYRMTNKTTGEVVELPYEQYLQEFKQYPKEEWTLEQIKTEPAIPQTKISDFEIQDIDGNDVTDDILLQEGYHFLIVAHKIPDEIELQTQTVYDTTFIVDTVMLTELDSIVYVKRVGDVSSTEVQVEKYLFPDYYTRRYSEVVNPVMEAAQAAGIPVLAVTSIADPAKIDDFRHATQSAYPFHLADDILLKTIIRSNPGIVLWKDGTVVKKWHYKQLPSFEQIEAAYLK